MVLKSTTPLFSSIHNSYNTYQYYSTTSTFTLLLGPISLHHIANFTPGMVAGADRHSRHLSYLPLGRKPRWFVLKHQKDETLSFWCFRFHVFVSVSFDQNKKRWQMKMNSSNWEWANRAVLRLVRGWQLGPHKVPWWVMVPVCPGEPSKDFLWILIGPIL